MKQIQIKVILAAILFTYYLLALGVPYNQCYATQILVCPVTITLNFNGWSVPIANTGRLSVLVYVGPASQTVGPS